jgi:two-component SAPR family response regulator
MTRPTSP